MDAVFEFVSLLQQAGLFTSQHKVAASEIILDFLDPEKKLGLSQKVIENVLNDPLGITVNDLYPVIDDFDKLQRYMHDEMKIGKIINLEQFIDFRFAEEARKK